MSVLAASPALTLGPPGWVFFAAVVIGTAVVGVVAINEMQSQTVPDTRSQAKTKDCTTQDCPRPWSVRVHAQGTDIGGSSGSTIGAPPIVKTISPVLIAEGVTLATATYVLLTKRQAANLAPAYEKCIKFIRSCGGFLGQKSFYGLSRDNNRFDVDSYGPSPNFVS
jgi:hypothetical protein